MGAGRADCGGGATPTPGWNLRPDDSEPWKKSRRAERERDCRQSLTPRPHAPATLRVGRKATKSRPPRVTDKDTYCANGETRRLANTCSDDQAAPPMEMPSSSTRVEFLGDLSRNADL